MRTTHFLATLTALLMTSQVAFACSCELSGGLTEEEQIESEFSAADAVIVAKVVSTKLSLHQKDRTGRYWIEDASFVVSEVLKGTYKVGESVRVRSMLGGGSCGRSARNDPPWLETTSDSPAQSGQVVLTAAVFSDEWLIYARGAEPYELSICSRSFPMDLRGGSDAEYIRTVVLQSGK
jgi:hypothetical protein